MRDWEADESHEPQSKSVAASSQAHELVPTSTSAPAPRPTPPLFKPPLLPKAPRHSLPKTSANPPARARASLALDGPSTSRPSASISIPTSTPTPSLVPPPAREQAKSKVYAYHYSHPAAPATPASSKVSAESFVTPAPLKPGASRTPVTGKVFGMNTRSVGRSQPKFRTPFKAGLAPGEPGRLDVEQKAAGKMKTSKPTSTKVQTAKVEVKKSGHVAFDLSACHDFLEGSRRLICLPLTREITKSSKSARPSQTPTTQQ
jgi:breast cancer 2 susceptibility protein